MRTPESIRDECEHAGYRGPNYVPHLVVPNVHIDEADVKLAEVGRHLGSAWWEKRLRGFVKKEFGRRREGRPLGLTEGQQADLVENVAWHSVCETWVPSKLRNGRRIFVGDAFRHGRERAERTYWAMVRDAQRVELGGDGQDVMDRHVGAGGGGHAYTGINDAYYRLPADVLAIRNIERGDFQTVLANLPFLQRQTVIGCLTRRPQERTAQIVGVDVRTIRRTEEAMAHLLRSCDWEESSLEGIPLVYLTATKIS